MVQSHLIRQTNAFCSFPIKAEQKVHFLKHVLKCTGNELVSRTGNRENVFESNVLSVTIIIRFEYDNKL